MLSNFLLASCRKKNCEVQQLLYILLLCLSQTCAWWCLRAASHFFLSENTLSFSRIDMPHSCTSLHSVEFFSFVQFQKFAYSRLRRALGSNMLTCKFFVQQLQKLFLLGLHSLKQQYNVTQQTCINYRNRQWTGVRPQVLEQRFSYCSPCIAGIPPERPKRGSRLPPRLKK